eukprot:4142162-Prymnesium_polylepis.1
MGRNRGKANSYDMDTHRAARNSQGVVALTLSYFVSGAGGLVVFTAPATAVVGGWVALLGYALSLTIPLWVIGCIAPFMRKYVPKGFTMNEYVVGRYGTVHAVYFALVAVFYMDLYMAAELASAGTFATSLSKMEVQNDTWWHGENVLGTIRHPDQQWEKGTFFGVVLNVTHEGMPISPIIGTSLVTLSYTIVGGLPVSMATDQMQGLDIFGLGSALGGIMWAINGVDEEVRDAPGVPPLSADGPNRFRQTALGHGVHPKYIPTDYGNSFALAITLIMAETCSKLIHAGYWQRIWAAKSDSVIKHATKLSSAMSVIVVLLIGPLGWAAYSHLPWLITTEVDHTDLSSLAVPWLCAQTLRSMTLRCAH